MKEKSKSTVYSLILCALFAALIAVGAFIKIPVPFVPFTLQLLFTTLAGIVLGPKSVSYTHLDVYKRQGSHTRGINKSVQGIKLYLFQHIYSI